MVWRVESYQDARGRVPVNDTLKSLAATDQARVLRHWLQDKLSVKLKPE
jgi:hypothetical protein